MINRQTNNCNNLIIKKTQFLFDVSVLDEMLVSGRPAGRKVGKQIEAAFSGPGNSVGCQNGRTRGSSKGGRGGTVDHFKASSYANL